jgi:hypothetical protein
VELMGNTVGKISWRPWTFGNWQKKHRNKSQI